MKVVSSPDGERRRGFLGALIAALTAPWLVPRRARAQQSALMSVEAIVPVIKDITRGVPAVRTGATA